MKSLLVLLCLFALSACRSLDAAYTPPGADTNLDYKRSIHADFDTTWSALIDHASTTFFAIENFEKNSGLLILSFGASDIPEFVDCGHWSYHFYEQHNAFQSTRIDFDGPYAFWIESEVEGTLQGKMNIRVREMTPTRTDVVVSAKYILRDRNGDRWVFSSGNSATIEPRNRTAGTVATRTCQPTHRAERSIIDALAAITSAR